MSSLIKLSLLPNLRGIEHLGCMYEIPPHATIKDLICTFADKLEYLGLYQDERIDYNFASMNFKKLQYFMGVHMSTESLNDIFKTSVNLNAKEADDEMIDKCLTNNNLFNFRNVTKLICTDFEEDIDDDMFTRFLSHFPELRCLELRGVGCSIDVDAVREVLPHINSLLL